MLRKGTSGATRESSEVQFEEELLTAVETAKELSIDTSTVYQWVNRGILRAIKIPAERKDTKWASILIKRLWIKECLDNFTTKTIYDKEESK